MRQNQKQNRTRGRGRRPGGQHQPHFNRNTTFESNGPEGRLRGNAQQLYDKYTALAHDANAAGERVSAEAFSQFADHYYRVNQSIVQAAEQRRANDPRQQENRSGNGRTAEAASEEAGANQKAEKADSEKADTVSSPAETQPAEAEKSEDGKTQAAEAKPAEDDSAPANAVA